VAGDLLLYSTEMFRFVPVLMISLAAFAASAATLEQLSLDQLSESATSIVRARITSASASFSGRGTATETVYTHYRFQVTETLKGSPPAEFVLPGGVAGHYRQSFPGVPQLAVGTEYVLFLWTSSRTGLTHPVGLSQGILNVAVQPDGSTILSRPRIGELMLNATGRPVPDQPPSTGLSALRSRILAASRSGAAQ
jgi:hypothetical protein